MGYDISLLDPVTKEEIELPIKHLMLGNTYEVDYDPKTGQFTPKPTFEAHLGITYNYANYYYSATEGDDRFFGQLWYEEPKNLGIRGIYGKTGAESIRMLHDMICRIEPMPDEKCDDPDCKGYWKPTAKNAIRPLYQLIAMAQMRPDGIWDGD